MKKSFIIFLSIALVCSCMLTSCFSYSYNGAHVDLYTVAVNNVFGIKGYLSNGEVSYNPTIDVIAKDKYGRTLFLYSEYYSDSHSGPDFGIAFVVLQKSDEDYVYYYQDVCYTPYFGDIDGISVEDYDEIKKLVKPEIINELLANNDWNKEIDDSKCSKSEITDDKPIGQLDISDSDFDEIIYDYAVEHGYKENDTPQFKLAKFCNSDKYGRELYYVYATRLHKSYSQGDTLLRFEYAIIFNPDGSCPDGGIIEITDVSESYGIVKSLKETCDWNKPI